MEALPRQPVALRTVYKKTDGAEYTRNSGEEYKVNLEDLFSVYPDMLKMTDYDDCIVGVCRRFGQEPILAYDYELVI